MLLQFTVENFRSFRDRTTISLLAAENTPHDPAHVFEGPDGLRVLRCLALYGANASGKSNVVRAIEFMRDLAVEGTRPGQLLPRPFFALDPEARDRPVRCEAELALAGRRYSYGFEITSKQVLGEWLYSTPAGREEVALFEREASDGAPIVLGDALSADPERRKFLEFVALGTRRNQLFLAEARDRNVTELSIVTEFLSSLLVVRPSSRVAGLAEQLDEHPDLKNFLRQLVMDADTGVVGLAVARINDLPTPGSDGTNGSEAGSDAIGHAPDAAVEHKLLFRHPTSDGSLVSFELENESDGTQRLLDLGPALFALQEHGGLVVVDELEQSLHPHLTRAFLKRFLELGRGQLIFTTHDSNLLSGGLMPADSIGFTEKDSSGATSFHSLADYRKDQLEQLGDKLEAGYLHGRFGGIPFLRDRLAPKDRG